MAAGYNEKALQQQALEACKVDKDSASPDFHYAMELTGMVEEHMASLPPPPPLPTHAPPQLAYNGQEVPPQLAYNGQEVSPPPSVLRRRRHDHPHGVVIDPPAAQEVIVLDDEDM
jgi:hypothetical protein